MYDFVAASSATSDVSRLQEFLAESESTEVAEEISFECILQSMSPVEEDIAGLFSTDDIARAFDGTCVLPLVNLHTILAKEARGLRHFRGTGRKTDDIKNACGELLKVCTKVSGWFLKAQWELALEELDILSSNHLLNTSTHFVSSC